ncbi:ead/Ea22-like family protein [Klebsiella pasteurii]|nr:MULTISPECIES: ead/Ea22-like family protein [Klebsiella]MDS7912976.1 ead/Ea22-like family protein [Klebsiella pasteurii]
MTTDITELAQSLKAAAEKATPGPWGVARDGKMLVSNQSHPIATVSDAMHRMLADGSTGKDAEFIALANPTNILALVDALEKAQAINAAAEKLVRCKGRYHSEQNYRALAALFGVTTPDLPPLDGELVGEVIEVGDELLVEWHKNLEEGAKLYTTPQAPVMPFGLHPDTQKLVTDFCTALAEKLYKAQLKYGYDADWKHDGWPSQCQAHFHQHIAKGDPRDVAAYCAFMWWHGWSTKPAEGLGSRTVNVKPMRPGHITVGGEKLGIYMRDEVDEFLSALTAAGIKWEAE